MIIKILLSYGIFDFKGRFKSFWKLEKIQFTATTARKTQKLV